MANADLASEACRQVLAAGNELMAILQEPEAVKRLAEIQTLLSRRQEALDRAGSVPPELATALTEQQQALEVLMKRAMADLMQAIRGAQATRASLDSFHQLLKSGTRSRLIDERK